MLKSLITMEPIVEADSIRAYVHVVVPQDPVQAWLDYGKTTSNRPAFMELNFIKQSIKIVWLMRTDKIGGKKIAFRDLLHAVCAKKPTIKTRIMNLIRKYVLPATWKLMNPTDKSCHLIVTWLETEYLEVIFEDSATCQRMEAVLTRLAMQFGGRTFLGPLIQPRNFDMELGIINTDQLFGQDRNEASLGTLEYTYQRYAYMEGAGENLLEEISTYKPHQRLEFVRMKVTLVVPWEPIDEWTNFGKPYLSYQGILVLDYESKTLKFWQINGNNEILKLEVEFSNVVKARCAGGSTAFTKLLNFMVSFLPRNFFLLNPNLACHLLITTSNLVQYDIIFQGEIICEEALKEITSLSSLNNQV